MARGICTPYIICKNLVTEEFICRGGVKLVWPLHRPRWPGAGMAGPLEPHLSVPGLGLPLEKDMTVVKVVLRVAQTTLKGP